MINVYAIADLHLSHKAIAIARGFGSIEEHDNHIINRWNSVVNKKDTVWLLGDVTMEKSTPYYLLERLNGIINVVLGNHDRPQHVRELLKYVNMVCGTVMVKEFLLTHCPIHESSFYGKKNIHGHVHEKSLNDSRYVNVSCEAVDYRPLLINSLNY